MFEALSSEIEQVESVPQRIVCQPLPEHELVTQLELEDFPQNLLGEIYQNQWFSIDGNRIVFEEVHKPSTQSKRSILISDFDDTILNTTGWHQQELQILEKILNIPQSTNKRLYEASKIFIDGKASKEARYTPRLNLILIEKYLQLKESLEEEQIWPKLQEYIDQILDKTNVEMFIRNLPIDHRILAMFKENNTQDFVHRNFVNEIFDNDQTSTSKIIASRGKIEGPLGQIWKIHQSQVAQKADVIFYTNDFKTEVLDLAPKIFPNMARNIVIYEDNPREIDDYCRHIGGCSSDCLYGIIQVRHRESKRRDKNPQTIKPSIRISGGVDITETIETILPLTQETIYDVHFPQIEQKGPDFTCELIADIPQIRK